MKRIALALCASLALVVGVATATASNSDAAHACQQNGWQTLVRGDLSHFANQSDCVSYAANGGALYSFENFSEQAAWSAGATQDTTGAPNQPTTFPSGLTLDPSSYSNTTPIWWFPKGGILQTGNYFAGLGPAGTHFLFTGLGVNTAKFNFTNPAKTVQVTAEPDTQSVGTTLTLTGYDASGAQVAQTSVSQAAQMNAGAVLKITSASANIKSFTVSVDDGNLGGGLGISSILWG
jgi:hypothetical protein